MKFSSVLFSLFLLITGNSFAQKLHPGPVVTYRNPVIADSLPSSIQMEASLLPRWDRAPRIGINVSGSEPGNGEVKAVQMK